MKVVSLSITSILLALRYSMIVYTFINLITFFSISGVKVLKSFCQHTTHGLDESVFHDTTVQELCIYIRVVSYVPYKDVLSQP